MLRRIYPGELPVVLISEYDSTKRLRPSVKPVEAEKPDLLKTSQGGGT